MIYKISVGLMFLVSLFSLCTADCSIFFLIRRYIPTCLILIILPVTFVLSEDIACKQVIGAPDAVENSPIWVNLHSCERYNLHSSVL